MTEAGIAETVDRVNVQAALNRGTQGSDISRRSIGIHLRQAYRRQALTAGEEARQNAAAETTVTAFLSINLIFISPNFRCRNITKNTFILSNFYLS